MRNVGSSPGAGSSWSAGRLLAVVVAAAVLVGLVRALLVQSFVIPSESMQPTLHVGDRVLVSRLDYRFGDVHRGDVVVFDGVGVFTPRTDTDSSLLGAIGRTVWRWLGVPVDAHDYVKRVIGLPGDHVVCCDATGRLTVNGTPLDEPYLFPGDTPSEVRFDISVPPGRLWVMGDHRSDSGDSRDHLGDPGGGTVPLDRLVGRVVAVWWPLAGAGGIGRVDPFEATPTPVGAATPGRPAQEAVR